MPAARSAHTGVSVRSTRSTAARPPSGLVNRALGATSKRSTPPWRPAPRASSSRPPATGVAPLVTAQSEPACREKARAPDRRTSACDQTMRISASRAPRASATPAPSRVSCAARSEGINPPPKLSCRSSPRAKPALQRSPPRPQDQSSAPLCPRVACSSPPPSLAAAPRWLMAPAKRCAPRAIRTRAPQTCRPMRSTPPPAPRVPLIASSPKPRSESLRASVTAFSSSPADPLPIENVERARCPPASGLPLRARQRAVPAVPGAGTRAGQRVVPGQRRARLRHPRPRRGRRRALRLVEPPAAAHQARPRGGERQSRAGLGLPERAPGLRPPRTRRRAARHGRARRRRPRRAARAPPAPSSVRTRAAPDSARTPPTSGVPSSTKSRTLVTVCHSANGIPCRRTTRIWPKTRPVATLVTRSNHTVSARASPPSAAPRTATPRPCSPSRREQPARDPGRDLAEHLRQGHERMGGTVRVHQRVHQHRERADQRRRRGSRAARRRRRSRASGSRSRAAAACRPR